VQPEHLNQAGKLHGGFMFTLVDVITTYGLMTYHKEDDLKVGASIEMHISYLREAKEGDELQIEAETIKCGKTIAFTECVFKTKTTGLIIAKGLHTKFVGAG